MNTKTWVLLLLLLTAVAPAALGQRRGRGSCRATLSPAEAVAEVLAPETTDRRAAFRRLVSSASAEISRRGLPSFSEDPEVLYTAGYRVLRADCDGPLRDHPIGRELLDGLAPDDGDVRDRAIGGLRDLGYEVQSGERRILVRRAR